METLLTVATELTDVINDSQYDLDRAKKEVYRTIRQIEQIYTFKYMYDTEVVYKSGDYFSTTKNWGRRIRADLYGVFNGKTEFIHNLQYIPTPADQVPDSYLPNDPNYANGGNPAIPFFYSFGQFRSLDDQSVGYVGETVSGREILLFPRPDPSQEYLLRILGYTYTFFDPTDPANEKITHWLFDNAFDAVIARASVASVKYTKDIERLPIYQAEFSDASSILISADISDLEEEASPISLQYQGSSQRISDSTEIYPPVNHKSRAILGE